MTFSFNLVLALFLLAPGFAAAAGLYVESQIQKIKSPPPPPGSILSLTIITVGALAAHLAGAAIYGAQDLYAHLGGPTLRLPFDPNPYRALASLAAPSATMLSGGQIVQLLASLLGLTVLAFFAAGAGLKRANLAGGMNQPLYGWLSDIPTANGEDEAVLAYIVSDIEHEGVIVGYEGVVVDIVTNSEKEIASVLLSGCETFYLVVSKTGLRRQRVERTDAIPQLHVQKEHIRNIAFQHVVFVDNAGA